MMIMISKVKDVNGIKHIIFRVLTEDYACNRPLKYQSLNFEINIIPLVAYLLQEGIPIMLYRLVDTTSSFLTQISFSFYH